MKAILMTIVLMSGQVLVQTTYGQQVYVQQPSVGQRYQIPAGYESYAAGTLISYGGANYVIGGDGTMSPFTGASQDVQQPGYGQQFYQPQQSFPTQGFPTQGYPTQGFPTQGFPTQGFPTQGFPTRGGQGNMDASSGLPATPGGGWIVQQAIPMGDGRMLVRSYRRMPNGQSIYLGERITGSPRPGSGNMQRAGNYAPNYRPQQFYMQQQAAQPRPY